MEPRDKEEPSAPISSNHHGEIELRRDDLDGDEGGGGAYGRPRLEDDDEDEDEGGDQPA